MKKENSLSNVFLMSALVRNPALIQAAGLCPLAAAVSLKTSALLAGVMAVILISAEVISSLFLKRVPRFIRMAVYMLVSVAALVPLMLLIDSRAHELNLTVGVYLPLLSCTSLTALRCEKFAVRSTVPQSFVDAAGSSLGYGVVIIITGILREMLASGSIGGRVFTDSPAAKGFLLPFGAFVIIGFFAALVRRIIRSSFSKYEEETAFRIKYTAAGLAGCPAPTKPEPDIIIVREDEQEASPPDKNTPEDVLLDDDDDLDITNGDEPEEVVSDSDEIYEAHTSIEDADDDTAEPLIFSMDDENDDAAEPLIFSMDDENYNATEPLIFSLEDDDGDAASPPIFRLDDEDDDVTKPLVFRPTTVDELEAVIDDPEAQADEDSIFENVPESPEECEDDGDAMGDAVLPDAGYELPDIVLDSPVGDTDIDLDVILSKLGIKDDGKEDGK